MVPMFCVSLRIALHGQGVHCTPSTTDGCNHPPGKPTPLCDVGPTILVSYSKIISPPRAAI